MIKYFDEDVRVNFDLMSDDAKKTLQEYVNFKATSTGDADGVDVDTLRIYAEVFVLMNKLFSEESKTYVNYIFPTLAAINELFEDNTAVGLLNLSLLNFPKLLSKKANVNLRAIVKGEEKRVPFRKHPAVLFFESLLVLFCLAKGQFEDDFLCDSVESFLKKFSVFNPEAPEETIKTKLAGKVSNGEAMKFIKSRMSDAQVKQLLRIHNVMALVVMMTKNKRFKACELSVRVVEGECTQGFKPGGDNNARVIRLALLHRLLNDRKLQFITSLSQPPPTSTTPQSDPEKITSNSSSMSCKRPKRTTSIAKKSPSWRDINVVEYTQAKGDVKKSSAKRVAKPKSSIERKSLSKRGADKTKTTQQNEYRHLDVLSPQQSLFPPSLLSPSYDEVDDAIVQTVGSDDSVADFSSSPFFSFSVSYQTNDEEVDDLESYSLGC